MNEYYRGLEFGRSLQVFVIREGYQEERRCELEFEIEKFGQLGKLRGEFGFWMKLESVGWLGQSVNGMFCFLVFFSDKGSCYFEEI